MDTTLLDTSQDDNLQQNSESHLSPYGHSAILRSTGWMRIAGIILCLLGAVLGIFTIWWFSLFNVIGAIFSPDGSATILVAICFFYGSVATSAILLGVLLLRAIGAYSDFATFKDGSNLDKALHRTSVFWTALGIATISVLGIFFVLVVMVFSFIGNMITALTDF